MDKGGVVIRGVVIGRDGGREGTEKGGVLI